MDVERAKMSANSLVGCFLGSKSAARQTFPDKDLIFNAQIWAKDDDGSGEIRRIHCGDLIVEDHKEKLEALATQLNTELYVYRESTINNEVINGRMFPYERYSYVVEKISRGQNPAYELRKVG